MAIDLLSIRSGYAPQQRRKRTMSQQGETAESPIKALIEAWADAVRRHDLSGILAHHEQHIVMFDVPPPLQSRGMDEYKKTGSSGNRVGDFGAI